MRRGVAAALRTEGAGSAVLAVQREAGARQHCQAAQEPLPVRPGTRTLAGRVFKKLGNGNLTPNQHNMQGNPIPVIFGKSAFVYREVVRSFKDCSENCAEADGTVAKWQS